MTGAIDIRAARPDDAPFLAPLINRAGEDLPMLTWTELATDGQSPWDVAEARIRGKEAGISHGNGWVAELEGVPAGCLFAYSQPSQPALIDENTPPIFRELIELENAAPGTGYIYILSTKREARGNGVGTALLHQAEARYRGPNGMSLIVSDGNPRALKLYDRMGFVERERRPMIKEGWDNPGDNFILMVKP